MEEQCGGCQYSVKQPGGVGARVRAGASWQAWIVTITPRVEHVGSLLRPDYLLAARKAQASGVIGAAEFKAAEDRAVRAAVTLQEDLDLPVINDGEMRRESFQAELTAACDGFDGVSLDAWLWGDWHSSDVGEKKKKKNATLRRGASWQAWIVTMTARGTRRQPAPAGLPARRQEGPGQRRHGGGRVQGGRRSGRAGGG